MAGETILLASFQQETTTFNEQLTQREDFSGSMEYEGQEVLDHLEGTDTYNGGVIKAAQQADVNIIPSIAVRAPTGGPVSREAYDYYTDRIVEDVQRHAEGLDGVILTLHGAMVPEGMTDGEGPLIQKVRSVVGDEIPIVVTLDLHALTTDLMINAADLLVTVENYPHDDMRPTAEHATEMLLRAIQGEVTPQMEIERVPLLPEIPKMLTYRGPMAKVEARARELEKEDGILKINVNPTHQHSDVPQTAFSFVAVTDDAPNTGRRVVEELGQMAWEMRDEFVGEYPNVEEGIRHGEALANQKSVSDPVLLVDVGDNVGGGGSGDGTAVLRELIDQGVSDVGLACIWDPESVTTCIDAGVGERVTLSTFGSKADNTNGQPLENFKVYVKAITDGIFQNTGPFRKGDVNHIGRTVLLKCGPNEDIQVLVNERRHSPNDAEIWRHVGIQPETMPILVIKSVNHFRADYEQFVDYERIITMDSPGLFPIDLTKFDFENLHRPMFPLDEVPNSYESWDA